MTVHIALLGKTKEPVLIGYRHYTGIETLYLLHSPNSKEFGFRDVALGIKNSLESIGFRQVKLKEIDAFDMMSVISAIIEISRAETEQRLLINITGGTNLMAAAGCTAAFIVGAKAYYVLDTRISADIEKSPIIEVPIPRVHVASGVESTQLQILRAIHDMGGKGPNAHIREELDISPQTLSYHVNKLKIKELVATRRGVTTKIQQDDGIVERTDSRGLTVELTPAGSLLVNLLS